VAGSQETPKNAWESRGSKAVKDFKYKFHIHRNVAGS